jgi:hypothetical protein
MSSYFRRLYLTMEDRRRFDPKGVWAHRYPLVLTRNRRVWVHRMCAMFSPQCYVSDHKWYKLKQEVRRGFCCAVVVMLLLSYPGPFRRWGDNWSFPRHAASASAVKPEVTTRC